MPQDTLVYVLLVAGGLVLVASAFSLRARLAERNVLHLDSPKLGVMMKVTAFGLLVAVGALAAASPAWFLYKGYDSRLAQLEGQTRGLQTTVEQLNMHSLKLKLDFPPEGGAHPDRATVDVFVNGSLRRPDNIDRGAGGIMVSVGALKQGDQLRIEVRDRDKSWKSDDMRVPEANLRMRLADQ